MTYRNSSWTGRAARSLTEAFGPHTSPHVYETVRTPWWAWVMYALVTVAACVAIGVMLAEQFA